MWKTIVLCAAMFAGLSLSLAGLATRFGADTLTTPAALSLGAVGLVLCLVAPAPTRTAPPLPPAARVDAASVGN
jgi:hypothetical protein